ncbi:hypothetical protein NJ959_04655, partial [Symplocastrum sp. BBK-W-15]
MDFLNIKNQNPSKKEADINMIEINNPEINVDELMEKIKKEVANRSNILIQEDPKFSLPNGISTLKISHIEALLNDANFNSQVATKWPDKFNRFPLNLSQPLQKFFLKIHGFIFKKQRAVNVALIQALRESLALNQQLMAQVATLQEQFNGVCNRLTAVEEKVATTEGRLNNTEGRLNNTEGRLNNTEGRLNTTEGRLTTTEERLNTTEERLNTTEGRLNNTEG